MIFLLWNLLLALFWATISGAFSLRNLIVGFVIGFVVLAISAKALRVELYLKKVGKLLALIFMVGSELIKSSMKIAFDIVTPTHYMRPGIIRIKLDANTPGEITLFSNILSLTPGTLSLDVSGDGQYLFVHVMYIDDENLELVKSRLKRRFETPILELLR